MRKRHFATFGLVLVAVSVALLFASPGLALRSAIVNQLFSQKLIRADILEKNGDWRIDRGVITQVSDTQLTLREADGRIQAIPLSSLTRVGYSGSRLTVTSLAPRWRVLVTWPANGGAAESVDVQRVPGHGPAGFGLRKALVVQLFGPRLIRADVLEKNGDWRIDRGVITSVDTSQVTLREADGRVQSIPLSTLTRVAFQGRRLSVGTLASHWRVVVTWPASGTAQSVDVERILRGRSGQAVG
jgi:small-conductance mechanosensitive channel